MKKLTSLWLALLFLLAPLTGCAQDTGITGSADGPTEVIVSDSESLSGAGTDGSITDGPTSVLVNDGTGSLTEAELGPAVTGTETLSLGNTVLEEEGSYTSRDTVALYLMKYGTLPQNYITKAEAQALGWEGGSLLEYAPGKSIGGDRFGNYEGALPEADGRTYTECDIDTAGADERGAKRIVFSNDGLIFYTEDHYQTFTLLLGDGQDEGAAP